MPLKQLPLHDLHKQYGATFGAFSGFHVPEAYRQSTIHEHLHTRQSAGLFDISHKTQIEITGPDADALLSRLCPVNAAALKMGSVKYTFFLNENAGVIDHLVLMRLADDRFRLVVNGPRAERDLEHIKTYAEFTNAQVTQLDHALIAIQGPKADEVLEAVGIPVSALPFMHCKEQGAMLVSRSGYTGENGVEISLPVNLAEDLVRRLLKDARVTLSGQSARNSLRIEAGFCRYGNDLSEDITPVEAGLLRAIPKPVLRTGLFVGAPALMTKLASGGRHIRMGLTSRISAPLTEGAPILDGQDNEVGFISSTSHGPSVGRPIAMGYIHSNIVEFGLPIYALQQGKKIPLGRHRLPFVPAALARQAH